MSSIAIATLIKMMAVLPESSQNDIVERVREIIAEVQDEERWDAAFKRTSEKLTSAARRAKDEIAAGQAEPMAINRL